MGVAEIIYLRYRNLSEELAPFVEDVRTSVAPVHTTYNPLLYAAAPWRQYLERYCDGTRRALFLGMNPGPWGMAQTGIPFGEVRAVREWMGITGPVDQPPFPHPKRPISGFACTRSEVSGRRLWNLMEQQFTSAEKFFANHAVLNFCPLVFMSESGSNITPDKLPATYRKTLEAACRGALSDAIAVIQPLFLIGIGRFATQQLEKIRNTQRQETPAEIVQILHPSPASPAANRGWPDTVRRQLVEAGVWE